MHQRRGPFCLFSSGVSSLSGRFRNQGMTDCSIRFQTYATNYQTPDSAATATAILSGVKTKAYMLGLHEGAELIDCESHKDAELDTIVQWSQKEGNIDYHFIFSCIAKLCILY